MVKKEHANFYVPKNTHLYVTEFGHFSASKIIEKTTQIRNIYFLCFVVRGAIHFSNSFVHAGEAFLISKELLHSFSAEGDFEIYWIGFDGEGAHQLLTAFDFSSQNHMFFKIQEKEYVRRYLEAKFISINGPNKEIHALSTFLTCLPHLQPKEKIKPLTYVEQAKNFMDNNYQHPISIESVAKSINITEKHLYRLFKQTKNITPQKYLTKIRMVTAKRLLTTTNMFVKEVANNVGYVSQFTFSAMYKKYYGISPSDERKKIDIK